MYRRSRLLNGILAAALLLCVAWSVFSLLRVRGEAVLPHSARPGHLVAVQQAESWELELLEVALLLESGQRLTLCVAEEPGAVYDAVLRTEYEGAGTLMLRMVWRGNRSGRAELEALAIAHPSMLRATGLFLEFGEEELVVRAGGKQSVFRVRSGRWERME